MTAIVWSKTPCPYCDQAKALLKQRGIAYEERNITDGVWTKEHLMEAVPTARTVPQIFMHEKLIGGFTELRAYLENTAGGYGDGN
jgi:glutaredoxin 3